MAAFRAGGQAAGWGAAAAAATASPAGQAAQAGASCLASPSAAFATAVAAAKGPVSAAAARSSAQTPGWELGALAARGLPRWQNPASASLARQQRGYSRYLQFPARGGGGWGRGGGRGWNIDGNKVLWGLVGVNVGGFLLWRISPLAMTKHATVSLESVSSGRVWTPLTAAFSHADGWHLFANMLGLYFFGRDIGHLFGGRQLLMLYIAGGVAGSLAHVGWYWWRAHEAGRTRFGRSLYTSYSPAALGASAAVNAITVLDILLFPTRTILLYGILPMPAALFGALWLWQDISGALDGKGNIAHTGHLGGAAVGLAFYLLFRRGMIRPSGW